MESSKARIHNNWLQSDSSNQKQLLTKAIDIKSKLLFLNNWGVFRLVKLMERGGSIFDQSSESHFHLGELIFDQSYQSYFDIPIERKEINQFEPISLLKKKKLTQNKFYNNLKKNINNGLEAKSHLVSLLQKKKIWNNTTTFPKLNENHNAIDRAKLDTFDWAKPNPPDPLSESRFAQLDNNIVFSYVPNPKLGESRFCGIERSSIPQRLIGGIYSAINRLKKQSKILNSQKIWGIELRSIE